eukprot:CAMPEP_0178375974 /NCGR_PEP_ID=MMETSP0689_2-20121128/3165_1 /TAXON_ID=160604 /ORGANISM="Amphidinium massartii, Strain CS-259" /LENGTH=60 /DNA_ID=CAMNT_0019995985 /DNA_START=1674 /DNA_END=1853 /DNA_ORIENTATION=+
MNCSTETASAEDDQVVAGLVAKDFILAAVQFIHMASDEDTDRRLPKAADNSENCGKACPN